MLVYTHTASSALCYCWFAAGLAKTPDDAAKTQPQSDLANTCHSSGRNQHALLIPCSKQKDLATKLTCCSQLLKEEIGKKTQTTHQTKNPTTLQLDGVHDTLAQQIRMLRHCYAVRVNRRLWLGDMIRLPSHCWTLVWVCSKQSPLKLSPALWTAASPTHRQLWMI